MKAIIREYDRTKPNRDKTWKYVDTIRVDRKSIIGFDASSSNTGFSIVGIDGAVLYTCSLQRESNETPVEYKLAYKNFVRELLKRELLIEKIWYEEHFIGYAEAAKILFMLRSTIQEVLIEENMQIIYKEMSNKKWKKYLFQMCGHSKVPNNSEAEKKAIRECVVGQMPCLHDVIQDELDSLGVTMVALVYGEVAELESQKKPSSFKFETKFFGGDEDDDSDFFMQYGDGTGIVPKRLIGENCIFHVLNGREKFENTIYRQLCDEDLPLILRYDAGKYGSVTLGYKLGDLVSEYKYIYAVVWRKNKRK